MDGYSLTGWGRCRVHASCLLALPGCVQWAERDSCVADLMEPSLPPADLKLSLLRCLCSPTVAQWAERDSCVAEYMDLARADTPGMLNEAREWLLTQLDLYRWAACGTPCLL